MRTAILANLDAVKWDQLVKCFNAIGIDGLRFGQRQNNPQSVWRKLHGMLWKRSAIRSATA